VVGIAGGRRNIGVGQPRQTGSDAGNDSERNAGSNKAQSLLPATAENEGIAPLPQNRWLAGQPISRSVMSRWLATVAAALPANSNEACGRAAPKPPHEPGVVKDDIGLAQSIDRMGGSIAGSPGPGADSQTSPGLNIGRRNAPSAHEASTLSWCSLRELGRSLPSIGHYAMEKPILPVRCAGAGPRGPAPPPPAARLIRLC